MMSRLSIFVPSGYQISHRVAGVKLKMTCQPSRYEMLQDNEIGCGKTQENLLVAALGTFPKNWSIGILR